MYVRLKCCIYFENSFRSHVPKNSSLNVQNITRVFYKKLIILTIKIFRYVTPY